VHWTSTSWTSLDHHAWISLQFPAPMWSDRRPAVSLQLALWNLVAAKDGIDKLNVVLSSVDFGVWCEIRRFLVKGSVKQIVLDDLTLAQSVRNNTAPNSHSETRKQLRTQQHAKQQSERFSRHKRRYLGSPRVVWVNTSVRQAMRPCEAAPFACSASKACFGRVQEALC